MKRNNPEDALLPALQLASYALLAVLAIIMALKAGALPASRWEPMSAGTFPQLIFSCIAILCGAAMVNDLVKHGWPKTSVGIAWRRLVALKSVLLNLALFIVYVAAMPLAGFKLATFCYLFAAQLYLAPKRPKTVLIVLGIALLFSLGPYYLFADVFSIYLPRANW